MNSFNSFAFKTQCALAVSALALFAFNSPLQAATTYKKKILLYGPTLSPAPGSSPEEDFINSHPGEFAAIGAGSAVFDKVQWLTASLSTFQSFDAIVISDFGMIDPESLQAPALGSKAIWGSAVNGNILIVSADPRGDLGLPRILRQGIRFAAEQPGDAHSQTGLYIALDHQKTGEHLGVIQNPTEIPLLSWFGSFRAIEMGSSDNAAKMIAEHPILNVVGKDVGGYLLQGPGDQTQGFHTWPSSFFPVAYDLFDPAPTPATNCTPLVEADSGYELRNDPPRCSSGQAPLVYILARTAVPGALHRLEPAAPNLALTAGATANLTVYSTSAGSPNPNNPGGPSTLVRYRVVSGPNTGQAGVMTRGNSGGQPNGVWTASYQGLGTVTANNFQDKVQFFYEYNADQILTDMSNSADPSDPDDPLPGVTIEYAVTNTVNWHQASTPEVSLSVTTANTTEAPSPTAARIKITRTGSLTAPLTVHFCLGGTATDNKNGNPDPADYSLTASQGTVDINSSIATIASGFDNMEILVNPVDDTTIEPTETVYLALADVFDGTYVVAGLGYTNVNIIDNDAVRPVSAVASVPTATEAGQAGSWIVSTPSAPPVDFKIYFTISGTASNEVDYLMDLVPASDDSDANDNIVLPSGTCRVTVHAGTTASAPVHCTPLQDTRAEGTETARINLLPNPGYTINNAVATINILDDDSTKIPGSGYVITDIGDASHSLTAAWALNNPVTPTVAGDFNMGQRAYSWLASGFTDIPAIPQLGLGKTELTSAAAVNDNNWVLGAGRSHDPGTFQDADYYWLWLNGTSIQLVNPAAADFSIGPTAVNSAGHIVGASANAMSSSHAMFWSSSGDPSPANPPTAQDLGSLGFNSTDQSGASAVNSVANGARVTGWSQFDFFFRFFDTPTMNGTHAFRTQSAVQPEPINRTTDDLGNALGSETSSSAGFAINGTGEIVGVSDYAPAGPYGTPVFNGESRAAYKDANSGKHKGWKSLNILSGGTGPGTSSEARGINDSGLIVGWSRTTASGDPRAVIWEVTTTAAATDLNTKIPAADRNIWVLTNAQAINNNGAIVGTGTKLIGTPQQRAFLLEPSANLVVDTIHVDSAGNITSVEFSGTGTFELNAWTTKNLQSYLAGLFVQFVAKYTLNGFPAVYRQVNSNPKTLVEVHGIPSGNSIIVNNVVGLLWNSGLGFYTAQALNQGGYGATGVNGRVRALAISLNGDLYAGGEFNSAGGFPYSSGIGVYRASGGWQSSYIFSAFDVITSLTWTYPTRLRVYGWLSTKALWQVDGPVYPYDHNSDHINVSGNTAYWYTTSTGAFDGGWWSQN